MYIFVNCKTYNTDIFSKLGLFNNPYYYRHYNMSFQIYVLRIEYVTKVKYFATDYQNILAITLNLFIIS